MDTKNAKLLKLIIETEKKVRSLSLTPERAMFQALLINLQRTVEKDET